MYLLENRHQEVERLKSVLDAHRSSLTEFNVQTMLGLFSRYPFTANQIYYFSIISDRSKGVHTIWDDLILPGMKKAIIYVCQTAQDIVDYRLVLWIPVLYRIVCSIKT